MPKIFLTGGSGFVGSWIARYLYKAGFKLVLLLRKTSNTELISDIKYEKVVGDLLIPESYNRFPEVDYIIHAGASVRSRLSRDYYLINTDSTKALLDFAENNGVKGFLLLSSMTAAGPRGYGYPVSHYGNSKLSAEKIVKSCSIPFLILRLPVVYGPGDREGVRMFKLLKNNVLFLPGHDLKLNLIYVRDLADLVLKIIEDSYFTNKILNVSDGQVYNLSDILKIAAFLMGKTPVTISLPFPILAIISVLCDGLLKNHPLITRDKLREFRFSDWTFAQQPSAESILQSCFDIEQGLKETINSLC